MHLQALFKDKTLKPKEKTEQLSRSILDHTISVDELIAFARSAKDPVKATCIESLEFASKSTPDIVTPDTIYFVINALSEKASRIKWEAAKVIGNTIHLFPDKVDEAAHKLLENTKHEGTVVRWSAAFALCQILKLHTNINHELIPFAENIIGSYEKSSIKKIYLAALKEIKKSAL